MDFTNIVLKLREEENLEYKKLKEEICKEKDLVNKCILIRKYIKPQSNFMEKMIVKDLGLEKTCIGEEGDAKKGKVVYEIKYSGHSKNRGTFNIVQLKLFQEIDFYLIVFYDLYEGEKGKTYIFKIPHSEMVNLVGKYGNYAHGNIKNQGKINVESILSNTYEYCIRLRKNSKVFKYLQNFEVEYKKENF